MQKTAGLTHHWTHLAQRDGVNHRRLEAVGGQINSAKRLLDQSGFFDPNPWGTMSHQLNRYLESVGYALGNVVDSLDGKAEQQTTKLIAALLKTKAQQEKLSTRSLGRYKQDPAVAERAKAQWWALAKKTVETVDKYIKILDTVPSVTSEDWAIPMDVWTKIMKAATDVMVRTMKFAKIPLAGLNGTGKPLVNDDEISFNGKKPNDYESFVLERAPSDPSNFCKTGGPYGVRPYDIAVTNVLAAAHRIAPQHLEVHFEGEVEPLPTSPVPGPSKTQVLPEGHPMSFPPG